MFLSLVLLLIGLAILIAGAESLVSGASSISKKAGISPIVIGLTVVAFGTTAPELIVSIFSSIKDTTDLALGNIIGSNIANILLILGILSLIVCFKGKKNTTWKEIIFSVLAILVVFVMANDKFLDQGVNNTISRVDGLILLTFFAIFIFYTFKLFSHDNNNTNQGKIKIYSNFTSVLLIIGGLLFLFFGGQLLVNQAVILAKLARLSEMLIGLTIVAIGTSLPELATSVIAAKKGQTDIAIGNIVGSTIFNIFWVLGLASIIKPIPVSAGANFNILVCLMATLILFLFMFIGKKLELQRWQGGFFLLFYVIYIIYLVQQG